MKLTRFEIDLHMQLPEKPGTPLCRARAMNVACQRKADHEGPHMYLATYDPRYLGKRGGGRWR